MADKYRVASRHSEDIHTGRSFAPGETAVGVDPKHPHDRAAIDDGRLVLIEQPKKPAKQEASK